VQAPDAFGLLLRITSGGRLFSLVRPRKDHRSVDLISAALQFGRLYYTKLADAVEYAKFFSRSHHAVIRVQNEVGNMIATHEHAAGEFKG
jgi:hypothetical protein